MVRPLHIRMDKERLLYIVLWLILFGTPLVSLYVVKRHTDAPMLEWAVLWHIWRWFSVYLALFLVHDWLVAPLLVDKHRPRLYVFSIISMVIVFLLANHLIQLTRPPRRPFSEMVVGQGGQTCPPPSTTTTTVPFCTHDTVLHINKGIMSVSSMQHYTYKRLADTRFRPIFGMIQADFIGTLILVGLLGLNLGVKIFFKTNRDHTRLQELQTSNMKQQLEYLKYQISPHFFMNTLNNIHALVDIDPEMAKRTLLELSKMMRYLLYEGARPLVTVEKEQQFIDSYIALMRLRYTDHVDIQVDKPTITPQVMVPPLLTINFVENAFKHGVSYQKPSRIYVKFDIRDGIFCFKCTNTKHCESTKEEGGVGLDNARQRLELLFGDQYTLEINDKGKEYSVILQFPTSKMQNA